MGIQCTLTKWFFQRMSTVQISIWSSISLKSYFLKVFFFWHLQEMFCFHFPYIEYLLHFQGNLSNYECVTVALCISPANLITALCQWSSVFLLNLSALLNFITGDKMCICHSIFTTYSHITRTHSSTAPPYLPPSPSPPWGNQIHSGASQPRQILWWQTTRRWIHPGIWEWRGLLGVGQEGSGVQGIELWG